MQVGDIVKDHIATQDNAVFMPIALGIGEYEANLHRLTFLYL
jgi:hypothetical protein